MNSVSAVVNLSHQYSNMNMNGILNFLQGPDGRKRSLGERSKTSPRILMLNGKGRDDKRNSKSSSQDGSLETDCTTASSPASPGKVLRGTEKRRSLKSVKIVESDTESDAPATKNLVDDNKAIQDRPLPEIPPKP